MKHKLRAIRDLRAWGKLHLAQFSTTWKLDWELTIDQPSTSTPCSTLNTGQAFRFALSKNRKKRIQSTSSQPLLLLLFQIHHRIGNLANLIYLEFRFRFASKIVGFKGKSLSLLTPILDHVNFRQRTQRNNVCLSGNFALLFRIHTNFVAGNLDRSISSSRTCCNWDALLMSLWTFTAVIFERHFAGLSKEWRKRRTFYQAAYTYSPGQKSEWMPPRDERSGKSGRFTFPCSRLTL